MVSIEPHETYKWNMIIRINKSEFHLLLTIRSICSRLLKITTAFSGFLVRGCNSKAVVNKESMQQVFPHLQPLSTWLLNIGGHRNTVVLFINTRKWAWRSWLFKKFRKMMNRIFIVCFIAPHIQVFLCLSLFLWSFIQPQYSTKSK